MLIFTFVNTIMYEDTIQEGTIEYGSKKMGMAARTETRKGKKYQNRDDIIQKLKCYENTSLRHSAYTCKLGSKQLEWLEQGLRNSSAVWKVISSDIPVSVPTGANASILGRDDSLKPKWELGRIRRE